MRCLTVGMVVDNSIYGRMVVTRVESTLTWAGDNKILCRWYDGARYVDAHFSPDELKPIKVGA